MFEIVSWIVGLIVVCFVTSLLWMNDRATRYENEVKRWLDELNIPEYDFNICMDYYHRGESSWNAAQAMGVKDGH